MAPHTRRSYRRRLEDTMGHTAADTSWGAIATAAVGLDLLAITNPRFSFGVRAELGYTASLAPALTAKPSADGGDGDTIKLPMCEASLGHVDLGGRFFGMSIVTQF